MPPRRVLPALANAPGRMRHCSCPEALMSFPYQDPGRPPADRARDLLSRMTFEEKVAQMHALWLILSEDGRHRPRMDDFTGGTDPAAVTQALAHGLGQISRPLGSHGVDARAGVRALNRLQKF